MNKRRFTGAERKRIHKLVLDECCNNVDGNCVILFDNDEHTCPQLTSEHLCCNWFYNTVLPRDVEMYAKFMEGADRRVGICEICGKAYTKRSNRARFCGRCSANRKRMRNAIFMSKKRTINVDV